MVGGYGPGFFTFRLYGISIHNRLFVNVIIHLLKEDAGQAKCPIPYLSGADWEVKMALKQAEMSIIPKGHYHNLF